MAQGERRRAKGHTEGRAGAQTPGSALSPVQKRLLSVISDSIRRTGLAPARRVMSKALGRRDVEGHLAALARKRAITLGDGAHLSIRIADPDEAPVIDATSAGRPGRASATDGPSIDLMPGTLVRRLKERADVFVEASEDAVKPPGTASGDLVGFREKTGIGTGSVLLAQDVDGAMFCLDVRIGDDLTITLSPIVEGDAPTRTHRAGPSRSMAVQIEGALAGIIRVRPIQHWKGCARVPKRSEGTGTAKGRPTPMQAAVLQVLRSHVGTTGAPPSMRTAARDLPGGPRTAASVHKHVRELLRKGLVQRVPVGQRAYWPTDMMTVPIVEPETGKALAKSTIIDRVPSVLAAKLDPRPDFFVPATPEIAHRLGLEETDLVAMQAITEGTTGEIVIARAGERGRWIFGECRRDHDGVAQVRPIAGSNGARSTATDTAGEAVQVEGVVIGVVTFQSL